MRLLPNGNRELTIAAISFAAGGALIGFGCHLQLAIAAWGGEKVGDVLSGIGSFVTGGGTLLLAAAGFAGVQQWSKLRKMKRHALLADRVLLFSVELSDVMHSVLLDYPWPTRNSAHSGKQPIWQRLTEPALVKRLNNLRRQVDAVLPPASLSTFKLLLNRHARMRTMIENDLDGRSPEVVDWMEEFSEKGRNALAADLAIVKSHFKWRALLSRTAPR